MDHIRLRAIHFLKNAGIVCIALKNINLLLFRDTYNNALNVIRDLCCCKQTVYRVAESACLLFLARPMEVVIADRVL